MTSAGIEFELTRKCVKNINLRIHPPDGRVTVSRRHARPGADRQVRRRQSRLDPPPPSPHRRSALYRSCVTDGESTGPLCSACLMTRHRPGRSRRRRSRRHLRSAAPPRRPRPRPARCRRSPTAPRTLPAPRTPVPPRRARPGVGAAARRPHHPHPHPCHETQVGGMPHAHG